ncbi:hypothetical protein M9434_007166 [Picochlorum sp. BPE23]|nr:hypothetical protein M9434_007166 [Picochlorum sp. BPE23]
MSHTARGSSFVCSSAGANASDRKYWSLLPPFSSRITRMKQVPRKEGVHVLTQPLKPPGFPDIRLSMAAVELEHESGLALLGALAPTNELLSHIEMLGKPVRHILLPNTSPEHWIYGPDLSRSYPDAKMWVVKGFMEGKGVPLPGRSLLFREAQNRGILKTIPSGGEVNDEFPLQDIGAYTLDVPFFIESLIHLKEKDIIMVADTGIFLSSDDDEYSSGKVNTALAESLGIWNKLGPITKVVQETYDVESRKWAQQVLDDAEFDMVLAAHGTPIVADGKHQFRQCFSFLFD